MYFLQFCAFQSLVIFSKFLAIFFEFAIKFPNFLLTLVQKFAQKKTWFPISRDLMCVYLCVYIGKSSIPRLFSTGKVFQVHPLFSMLVSGLFLFFFVVSRVL
jgi:hypothetical protein